MFELVRGLWRPLERGIPPHDHLRPVRGRVIVTLSDEPTPRLDADGLLIGGRIVWDDHNLFLNNGYARQAAFLAGNSATPAVATPQYIGVGLSSTAPAAGDSFMGGEIRRQAITSASTQSTYTSRLACLFGATVVNFTLSEVGLWDIAGGASGTATGGSTTTLTDSGASFGGTNAQVGNKLTVVTAAGALRFGNVAITASTGTQLTFAAQGTAAVSGDSYFVAPTGGYLYAHANISVPKANGQTLQILWLLTQPSQ